MADASTFSAPPLGDAARDAVFRRLARQAHRFPELDVRPFEPANLSTRDAAFAHAIEDVVVRRWLTLEHLLSTHLTQPFGELEPRVRAALLAGSAQLLFLDSVPVHAAINHAVEWAKQRIRPGAGKLVNAVLRKVSAAAARDGDGRIVASETYSGGRDELPLADGRALALAGPLLPEDEVERLGVAASVPPLLLRRWLERLPMREVRTLAMHALAHPPIILNTAHAGRDLLDSPLLVAHDAPGHHVFTGTREQLVDLLRSRDDTWVQDPASSLAVSSVFDLKPALVLDLCAGQGTKTRQLAAAFPEATIVATDVSEPRLATLRSVFAGSERVRTPLPKQVRAEYLEQADLILLDVPCSNTGVLARRPEARYRFNDATLESLIATQRQIIADAIPLLAPGGAILYSSCSLEPEENQEQARWAAKWHGFAIRRENARKPHPVSRAAAGGAAGPSVSYSDGSYAALLSPS